MCFPRYIPDQKFDAPTVDAGRLVLRVCHVPVPHDHVLHAEERAPGTTQGVRHGPSTLAER